MKYNIRPEYSKLDLPMPLDRMPLSFLRPSTRLMYNLAPVNRGISFKRCQISGYQGKKLSVDIYRPKNAAGDIPVLFNLHGGAFIMEAAPHHRLLACDYALGMNCAVVMPHYSLAPENPFPQGLMESISVWQWLCKEARNMKLDSGRMAVCGDSAGGGLAASLCHILRDNGDKAPLFQMLIYPVTDLRMETTSMKEFTDTPIWNARLNAWMIKGYLNNGLKDLPEYYASPARSPRFDGLPPAYIETAEFDCLRDEGAAYHGKLRAAGVESVYKQTQGTIHGFEVKYDCEYTRQIVAERITFGRRYF